MREIVLVTEIRAPRERVFDLERSIDVHLEGAAHTGEEAIGPRRSGLLELGERVTWRARHFGLTWTMEVEISGFDRPRWFQDRMVSGPFASFVHDHHFEAVAAGTRMEDRFRFTAPLGPLGWLAERLFLEGHLRRFLEARNATIKRVAEAHES